VSTIYSHVCISDTLILLNRMYHGTPRYLIRTRTRIRARRPRKAIRFPAGAKFLLFTTASKIAVGGTPILLVNWYQQLLPEVKWPERETVHSHAVPTLNICATGSPQPPYNPSLCVSSIAWVTYRGGTTQSLKVFGRLHYHAPNTSTLTNLSHCALKE
jgi:hypothetical protein